MTELSCGAQCSRTLLFILNILFVICGFIILGFGIYLNVSKELDIAFSDNINTKVLGGSTVQNVSVVMIIIAVFTVLLAGFGCLGACVKNRVFLYAYATVLILMIIVEIGSIIALVVARSRIRDSYNSGFREFFIETYQHNRTDLEQFIEQMEQQFKCCGSQNYTDYQQNNFTMPLACYPDKNPHVLVFQKGCAAAVIDWINDKLPIVGGILGGILAIEIFGVIASVALGVAISHSKDY